MPDDASVVLDSDSLINSYNPPHKIARSLMTQNIQVISFFLYRLDNESLKSDIMRYLDSSILQQLETVVVEDTPIADKIYQRLYKSLCLKQDEDEGENEMADNEDDVYEKSQLIDIQDPMLIGYYCH